MQNSYLSVYARRSFQVPDRAQVKTLLLRLSYDDGVVAYLNGEEVVRRGLGNPGDPVAFDTPSTDHEASGFDPIDLTSRIPLLVQGTNLLAIEVHNRDLVSSDLSLHPHLAANQPVSGLPSGFTREVVAAGFRTPVGIAFAPDGRMFVAEKRGWIWAVEGGSVPPSPLLNLEEEINNAGDRWLLGLALDPDFTRNGYFYLLYVIDPLPGSPEVPAEQVTFGRLARFTAQGSTADPSSRKILLGHSAADGFVICHSSHAIGTVKFANDGTLFAGSGDGAHFDLTDSGQDVTSFDPACATTFGAANDLGAFRSQNIDTLAGKVVRVDPETGEGLPGNPYFNGDPFSIAS